MLQFGKMRILVFLLIPICSLRSIAQDFSYNEVSKISENVNSEAEEIMPLLSPDGRTLYFVRAFSALNKGGINAGQDIWTSQKDEEGWASVCNVRSLNNGENNAVIGMDHSGKVVYLINNYTALPRRKQAVASMRKTGKRWKMLSELPLLIDINTDHYGFYVSPDEDVILISMSGEGSLGEEDLYVSFKNDEKTWTTPKHLGEAF